MSGDTSEESGHDGEGSHPLQGRQKEGHHLRDVSGEGSGGTIARYENINSPLGTTETSNMGGLNQLVVGRDLNREQRWKLDRPTLGAKKGASE
ncbi:hypothetical protein ACFX15_042595 [Malus domestica]